MLKGSGKHRSCIQGFVMKKFHTRRKTTFALEAYKCLMSVIFSLIAGFSDVLNTFTYEFRCVTNKVCHPCGDIFGTSILPVLARNRCKQDLFNQELLCMGKGW
jgi:hypothetical protein